MPLTACLNHQIFGLWISVFWVLATFRGVSFLSDDREGQKEVGKQDKQVLGRRKLERSTYKGRTVKNSLHLQAEEDLIRTAAAETRNY